MAAGDKNDDKTPKKAPLGERVRDLINPALEDTRRHGLQLARLDMIFDQVANVVPNKAEESFTEFFNHMARIRERNPELLNPAIIDVLTVPDGDSKKYTPILRIRLPLSMDFVEFSSREICELPNYIRLHEIARELDIALKISGLTAEESRDGGIAVLTVNVMKTYDQGAAENPDMYPDLPPRPKPNDPRGGREFHF